MRTIATGLILALVAATSNLSWPCACEDLGALETAMAADHSCCPNAKAVAERAEPSELHIVHIGGVCSPGCCDAPATFTSLAAERAFAWEATAQPLLEAALATYAHAQVPPVRVLDRALAPRGPPGPIATRLALLQTWLC